MFYPKNVYYPYHVFAFCNGNSSIRYIFYPTRFFHCLYFSIFYKNTFFNPHHFTYQNALSALFSAKKNYPHKIRNIFISLSQYFVPRKPHELKIRIIFSKKNVYPRHFSWENLLSTTFYPWKWFIRRTFSKKYFFIFISYFFFVFYPKLKKMFFFVWKMFSKNIFYPKHFLWENIISDISSLS